MTTLQTILNTPPCKIQSHADLYKHKYTKIRLLAAALILLAIFLVAVSIGVWLFELTWQQSPYFLKELRGIC